MKKVIQLDIHKDGQIKSVQLKHKGANLNHSLDIGANNYH